jgi:hypothetical protein
LLDLAALVVGYSLAALGLRAFWPATIHPTPALGIVLALAFGWLGLAISGPFVLLLEGRRRAAPPQDPPPTAVLTTAPPGGGFPRFTAAETAWLLVGAYWIAVVLVVVPGRLPSRSTPLLGVLPVVAALLFWVLSAKRGGGTTPEPSWTHRAAVVVLVSWPLAWGALIVLSTALA